MIVSRFAETEDVNPKSVRHTVDKLRLQPCRTEGSKPYEQKYIDILICHSSSLVKDNRRCGRHKAI